MGCGTRFWHREHTPVQKAGAILLAVLVDVPSLREPLVIQAALESALATLAAQAAMLQLPPPSKGNDLESQHRRKA